MCIDDIQGGDSDIVKWYSVIHLTTEAERCQKRGLVDLAAKQYTSLLRFVREIPADKAFYNAGNACRAVNQMNMAFVFFNRYLDIIEAMDDPESDGLIENRYADYRGLSLCT